MWEFWVFIVCGMTVTLGWQSASLGKIQLFSAFMINELGMEEENFDAYISGRKLCDATNVLSNGNDAPLTLEVEKNCVIKKGGSLVQIPLGEEPVIITPTNDWLVGTTMDIKRFHEILFKVGRFSIPSPTW